MTDAFDFPAPSPEIVDKWDREWMLYLSTESKAPHLVRSSDLTVVTDISGMSRPEVFAASLTRFRSGEMNVALRVWARGDDLVGRRVAEIGCGAGFLGKQLGLICSQYLGLDVSQIAVAIARGTAPPRSEYLHLSERDAIAEHVQTYDTVVGREFFIHQNFENALWVLSLAARLLKPGGTVASDFYLKNPTIRQGVLHPAKSELDKRYASCAFLFTPSEVDELAKATGLVIDSTVDNLAEQRRFVVFRKDGLG